MAPMNMKAHLEEQVYLNGILKKNVEIPNSHPQRRAELMI
jgi:hypothetical protein